MMNLVDTLKAQINAPNPEKFSTAPDEYLNEQALKVYLRTTALGFITGIRSMSSLALLGLTSDNSSEGAQSPARWLLLLAAIGESVADKLPIIPSRIRPLPFIGRLAIGGTAGWIFCQRERVPVIPGVVTGIVGAGAGALTSYYGRTSLTKITKIPDPVLGILEDALVSGLGTLAVRKNR